MGILFESSTPIELLLREALKKENLPFYEQYRIGTGGRFSTVKYVADFMIEYENVRLIIECDGYTYHSKVNQKRKLIERDAWLFKHGYKVLHFSTKEIRHKMPFVINVIKYKLGLIERISIDKQNTRSTYYTWTNKVEYTVNLVCYYSQLPQGVCIAYVYEDKEKGVFSEIRQKRGLDIAADMAEAVSLYLALVDLKKNVNVHVFYAGEVFNNHFDVNKKIRSKFKLLEKGEELLRNHNFQFTHINLYARYSKTGQEQLELMRNLKKECLNTCKQILNGKVFDGYAYRSLLKSGVEETKGTN